jgi:phosphatidate cytidylyltransferase
MKRLLSGLALAGAFLGLVWFSTPLVLLVAALGVAALAFQEYARLVRAIGAVVPRWPTLAATLGALAMVPFPWVPVESVLGFALAGTAVSIMASNRSGPAMLHDAAAAILAPVYIGLPLGSLVAIQGIAGREAVLLLVATVVASDTGQYYAGRLFGRRPLAPRISPKKTREGVLGGFIAGPLVMVVLARYWLPAGAPASLAGIGILIVAAGIFGDLFESMLKRAANVKDSATFIPGHGGVLDRIDALLFATPVFYYYLRSL